MGLQRVALALGHGAYFFQFKRCTRRRLLQCPLQLQHTTFGILTRRFGFVAQTLGGNALTLRMRQILSETSSLLFKIVRAALRSGMAGLQFGTALHGLALAVSKFLDP